MTAISRISLPGLGLCLWLLAALAGCNQEAEPTLPQYGEAPVPEQPVYRFGIHPLHNPARLHEIFSPLIDYLNRHVDAAEFRFEASRNYAAYDDKLFAGEFAFSLPNPYQTVESLKHGYRVFGKMGDDEDFRGIILVRRDSGIDEFSDLRGKIVAYPAPSALAATMLPQHFLHSHGIDVFHELDNRYVGSQESAIMNVYLGEAAAGASWIPPWRTLSRERPELAAALEVRWQTDNLPNNGLVVREDVPPAIADEVGALLFDLHNHEEGRAILARMALSRFEPADNETYRPVREFIERFTRELRDPREAR
ncbi:MAG: phosphate/phosphite/phosphonate ABC transporter substrate-binding protein [Gammaproteobacteria bacterium]|nr:phosphate/phosphite/phosphonate ABC transporter substrate-binding protein [Gammaproteobacteria bacterium]MDX5375036.1 phosphate/phosphite/phosphonate ABC transporter substrate-binding protein [Gammaproteobacteria bacterium]